MRLPPSEFADNDGPNLTPVIDVVFLLLIFFLVATRFDQQERDLKINLAEVPEAQPLSLTKELTINILREGKYKIVDSEYSEDELTDLLDVTARKNPHQSVLIRPDARVEWRYVARATSICKRFKLEYQTAAVEEP